MLSMRAFKHSAAKLELSLINKPTAQEPFTIHTPLYTMSQGDTFLYAIPYYDSYEVYKKVLFYFQKK